ncbi:hypothetical protein AAG570_007255 [Ranatra chinensis]|uniref:PiggyBac transposable element-derived protein 4 C-terminal zinc-finger domain-containing protein n=1 Tax=Ranatra chinensis TaxID=642074 RepID=A0ABD0XVC8_9HEMI
MASKRRNMFQKNKTQETTEKVTRWGNPAMKSALVLEAAREGERPQSSGKGTGASLCVPRNIYPPPLQSFPRLILAILLKIAFHYYSNDMNTVETALLIVAISRNQFGPTNSNQETTDHGGYEIEQVFVPNVKREMYSEGEDDDEAGGGYTSGLPPAAVGEETDDEGSDDKPAREEETDAKRSARLRSHGVSRLTERHFPDVVPPTAKKQAPTRYCAVCCSQRDDSGKKRRKESRYFCKPCNVGLCAAPCFRIYHTEEKF